MTNIIPQNHVLNANIKLRELYELSQLLTDTPHTDIDINYVISAICNIIQAKRGMIVLLSAHDGAISIDASFGLSLAEKERGHYAFGEGIVGQVIKTGQGIIVCDIAKEPLFLNRTQARKLHKESVSFLCIPIKSDSCTIGALGIDYMPEKANYIAEVTDTLNIISCMIAPLMLARQEKIALQSSTFNISNQACKLHNTSGLVGTSEPMQLVYTRIKQVADSNATVLLRGESGTGKELVARHIHDVSARKNKAFVAVNCAALPESLIESELFGHEKGAFTGALAMRKGRFELADAGTLFLDEIGELSLLTQARLLRVLQEFNFERVGGTKTISVSVRIIAATNRDLEDMVNTNLFRRDLYYRLNVFAINLPPLRERKSDILVLANYFLNKYANLNGRKTPKIALSTMDMLHRYSWAGNIRELENLMERGILLIGNGEYLLPQHLPPELHSASCPLCCAKMQDGAWLAYKGTLPNRISELERACIFEALEQYGGHIGEAAKSLGITERIMALRMQKYDISYKQFR